MTSIPSYAYRHPTENPRYDYQYYNRARGYAATRYSILALAPSTKLSNTQFTQYVTLTAYCQKRAISKAKAKKWITYRWLLAIKAKGQIWVSEACPDEIEQYKACQPSKY